jgi:alanine racemase
MSRRPVWAEVDLAAIAHNAAVLRALVAPAKLCAVVKAFGYGHGPVPVAEAALTGGAEWLAVATVEEGVQLRQAGLTEPVLLLSEPAPQAVGDAVSWRLTPTLYTAVGLEAAAKAVAGDGGHDRLGVHIKVDTGMHRVGADPAEAAELAAAVERSPELWLEGLCTHLAVADEPDNPFTLVQLERFETVIDELAANGIRANLLHACNSAGALTQPAARYDLVRCGVALYGLAPSPALQGLCADLRPAMALKARVSYVRRVNKGERLSYGLRYRLARDSVVATVPVGYADGVPRRLSSTGGDVLIGGHRYPIAGTVTMDQLTVDCGDDDGVAVGDEVVLLGAQGGEAIDAWEWAGHLDTIAYEVTCGISARVPRVYLPIPA